ncbi:HAMP domain-containing sensor histidine kinase [Deinococcus sp.]|uniref:sensor histidine kinase n=1 Tax=Deinococcus sp. TaxID=47478 RepID=UPI0025B89341|nr:HAMP domain-containing sensor histidine kinase [Deinococcus sp.]
MTPSPPTAPAPTAPPRRLLGVLLCRQDLILALLPSLLSVALLTVAFLPAFRSLNNPDTTWSGYNYQGFLNRVLQYARTTTDPDATPARQITKRDQVLSDILLASRQATSGHPDPLFAELPERERDAGVRLNNIIPLVNSGTPADAEHAVRIAEQLNSAAHTHLTSVRNELTRNLRFMQITVLVAALVSGSLGSALILRALNTTRREQNARDARDAQHREALGMAAHELRRPLQALLLSTDALRGTDNPRLREHLLRSIEDQAAQLAVRTDLERLELMYVNIEPRPERTDLNALLGRLETERVRTRRPPTSIHVQADPNHLRQILENLIENAQRYSHDLILLTLDGPAPGRGPMIRVLDNGPGLPHDLVERVFDIGYRKPGTPHREGQGLGLPVARRLARANHADITLHSPEGGGLEARVTFSAPAPEPATDPPVPYSLSPTP